VRCRDPLVHLRWSRSARRLRCAALAGARRTPMPFWRSPTRAQPRPDGRR
jgi:hypothetical protein